MKKNLIRGFREYRYAIFDVDGVFVDCMPAYIALFCAVLIPVLEKNYRDTTGTALFQQIENLFSGKFPLSQAQIRKLTARWFKAAESRDHPLFEGVKPTLRALKSQGLVICAMSGARRGRLKKVFTKHNLPIDNYVGSSKKLPKGDLHIEFLATKCGVSKEEFCAHAFYVGDGETDMRIAKRNGIHAVGLTTTISAKKLRSAGANRIITDIRQLVE